ncbi:MAG: peptidoglycan recognition family protein [bacterium]|nr:peptidoglycan recognition family protein [bacterium]
MLGRLLLPFLFLMLLFGGFFYYQKSHSTKTQGAATQNGKYKYVDVNKFVPILSTDRAWYLDPTVRFTIDHFLETDDATQTKEWVEEKHEFFQFIGDLVAEGQIKLGETGDNRDEEREPIDTIVIHHTQTSPERDIRWLNGLQLLTLYVPVFSNPGKDEEYKQPIWSSHFDENGKMLFIAYHYLVYPDGRVENPLEDREIGWHAGDWGYNKRSIGLAFVDDLTSNEPTAAALNSARNIIAKYTSKNPEIEVIGHKQIEDGHTECPGVKFDEWKDKLIPQQETKESLEHIETQVLLTFH